MLGQLLNLIKSYIPRQLPIGISEFNLLLKEVLECSGLVDTEKNRTVAATFIFSLPTNVHKISVRGIAKQLRRAASMQVAKAALVQMHEQKEKKL